MKPSESVEWMKCFELRVDKLNKRVFGIDCWPVIRNTFLSMVHAKSNSYFPRFPTRRRSITNLIISLIKLIFLKKADTFILSDGKFCEEVNGRLYLKDSYALAEREKLNRRSVMIALQGINVNFNIVDRERCVSIYPILLVSAFVSRFYFLSNMIPGLSGYLRALLDELYKTPFSPDAQIDSAAVLRQLRKNIVFSIVAAKLFSCILKKTGCTKAYVVCYYSILGMSLCAACHRLGIPIADVQHGVSGRNMRAYAGWMKCPVDGYTTLPSHFLAWTHFDSTAINEHAPFRHNLHQASCVGSLWRSYRLETGLAEICRSEWADFIHKIASYRKRITITLQSTIVPPIVMELIAGAGADDCFLIRAHPDFACDSAVTHLAWLGAHFNNVFVLEPSRMPIDLLMSVSDVNITGWSASVYDAYFEGVRSIVVSELGRVYFEDFIREGLVVYAENYSWLKNHAFSLSRFAYAVD